jgi:hypothetical protein
MASSDVWETTVKNKKSAREEIKNILMLGNACYHFVLNLLSYHLLSKHLKTETQKYNCTRCFIWV